MIKNILFDLGGVIMDIRRDNCVEAFKKLGMADPGQFLGDYAQKGPFQGVEDGSVSASQFRDEIRKLIPARLSDEEIDDAFSQFLIGIPTHRLGELERLHESYRLLMLSNTNPIMWNGMIRSEFEKDGHRREDYFDGMVTSFEAHCAKPSPEIFRVLESRYGIVPEETLFFDDSETNVKAAEKLGFKGAVVRPGTEFTDYLPEKK